MQKKFLFFEKMVFEDEENGQWVVVPIHMISAFFFFFFSVIDVRQIKLFQRHGC
jgi:hypothetical protein